ncbi:hypothetical protein MASR2M79_06080 [Aminivibrio sp.]
MPQEIVLPPLPPLFKHVHEKGRGLSGGGELITQGPSEGDRPQGKDIPQGVPVGLKLSEGRGRQQGRSEGLEPLIREQAENFLPVRPCADGFIPPEAGAQSRLLQIEEPEFSISS